MGYMHPFNPTWMECIFYRLFVRRAACVLLDFAQTPLYKITLRIPELGSIIFSVSVVPHREPVNCRVKFDSAFR
jgi:hypothetical protein